MLFWLPYFRPKSFGFLDVQLLVCFCIMPSQLLIEFSFVVLECLTLSVLFYPLLISLSSSFFRQNFLVYFFKLKLSFFSCYLFHSVPTKSMIFLFYYLACFRRFLSALPVEFPIMVLNVSSCFLRGSQFFHKLILPLQRLFI